MPRVFFARQNGPVIGGLDLGSIGVTSRSKPFVRPTLALALFLAVILPLAFIRPSQTAPNRNNQLQGGASASLESQEPDNQKQVPAVSEHTVTEQSESGASSEANEITTRTTVTNGQADVTLEVNGEEIPVASQGTTHGTVTGANGQTQIDVSIQNGQTSSSVNSSGSAHVNSFSHSFQSTFFSGNNL